MHRIVFLSFIFTLCLFASTSTTSLMEENDFLTMVQKEHQRFVQQQEAEALRRKKAIVKKQRLRKIKIIKAKLKALEKKKTLILDLLVKAEKEKALKKKQALEKKRKAQKQRSKQLFAKIDLSQQRMKVYRGDKLLYNWKVSTGRKGHATPKGYFKPIGIEKMHRSKKYHNAAMPYSVFFRSGYAVHGTNHTRRLGRRASHGCIRLHISNAKKFYNLVRKTGRKNTSIRIVN